MEIARVKMITTGYAGAPGTTTLYFKKRTGLGWDNYVEDLLDRVNDFFTGVAGYWPTQFIWNAVNTIEIIDDENGELLSNFIGSDHNGAGAVGDSFLPLPTGLICTWKTAAITNGRHVRGRTFLVPLGSNAFSSDGGPVVALRTAVQTAAEAYIGTGGEAVVPVVWHRPKFDKVTHALTRNGAAFDVNGASTQDKFCVLRSRRD